MKRNAHASKRGFAVHQKNTKRKHRPNGHSGGRNNNHSPVPNKNIQDKRAFSVIENNEREIISDDDNFSSSPVREDFIFD